MKTCTCCNIEKPKLNFANRPRGKDGLNSQCRSCTNEKAAAKAKERYQNDPSFKEKLYAAQRKYRDSEKGSAAYLAAQRKYLATDNGRAMTKAANRIYKKNDPSIDKRRNDAMKIATPPWYDTKLTQAVYKESFRRKAEGIDSSVDHIVPLQSKIVCGLHVAWNMRIVTKSENSAKGNRMWPDMPPRESSIR